MSKNKIVSLSYTESQELAKVLSNETAQKILDLLAKKTLTESKIAKELSLSLPTIHYNLKLLEKAELINAEEYHYSSKGREVLHYKATNHAVIIVPRADKQAFLDKLSMVLPLIFIIIITTFMVNLFSTSSLPNQLSKDNLGVDRVELVQASMEAVSLENQLDDTPWLTKQASWFLLGNLFTLITLAVLMFFYLKKKQ